MEEKVLCYKVQCNGKSRKEQVEEVFKGIIAGNVNTNLLSFQPRSSVETDLGYIQLNYGVCFVKKMGEDYFVFTNKKINKSSEKRLMGRLNGLVSGHCNETDIKKDTDGNISYYDTLVANMKREVAEEVDIFESMQTKPTSYENATKLVMRSQQVLYTEDAEVSMHHACLYDIILLPASTDVEIKEEDKLEGIFIDAKVLYKMSETDGWTKTLISAELN